MAAAKVPESPYPPALFTADSDRHFELADPDTVQRRAADRAVVGGAGTTRTRAIWSRPEARRSPFGSTYERVAGGTSHWLGTCLRFVPNDFKMKTLYGSPAQFVDWPIGYERPGCLVRQGRGGARRVGRCGASRPYLGIHFPSGYSYPMPRNPRFARRIDAVGNALATLTEEDRRFWAWTTPTENPGPQPAGGAQFAALSKSPRLRGQHELHSDLPDPGQIRSDHHAERRAATTGNVRVHGSNGRERNRGRAEPAASARSTTSRTRTTAEPQTAHRLRQRQGLRHRGQCHRDAAAAVDVEE